MSYYQVPVAAVQPPQAAYYPQVPPPAYQYTPAPPTPPPFIPQPAPFRQPWTPPAPMQAPVQVPVQMMRPPTPAAPPPTQPIYQQQGIPWAPIHFQIPASIPFSPLGYYGYYPDQVWGALAAVPPVWRPQQPGESFASRAFKNVLLVLMEKLFEQGMFATRQMFLPPRPPPAAEATIDVARQ